MEREGTEKGKKVWLKGKEGRGCGDLGNRRGWKEGRVEKDERR